MLIRALDAPRSEPNPEPGLWVKPTADNTGPRSAPTRTITGSQALSELRTNGTISGAAITGGLEFSGTDGVGWTVEDCRIEGGVYVIRAYVGLTAFPATPAERPIIRHCDIIGNGPSGGRSSACVYGEDVVIDACNIWGADDGAKPTGRIDLLRSWIHDMDKSLGSHCDGIQIRNGTGILVQGCRIDAYVGTVSDGSEPPGDWCSGGLQTGSMVGPVEAQWLDNWWAGGRYTLRGAEVADPPTSYVWRRNRFMPFGTSVALGRTDMPSSQFGPTTEDLGDFDTSNVWEHTGQPVT